MKTLFVTHTKDLLNQARKEFERRPDLGFVGKIGDGSWNPDKVTAATVQTLARQVKTKQSDTLNFLSTVEFVVFDEVHRSSKSYQNISAFLTHARWRLGLSATACITDKGNSLHSQAMTGPVIYEISMEKLVEEKRIAKPIVKFLQVRNKVKIREWIKWQSIYEDGIVNNDARNLTIVICAVRQVRANKACLVLVESVEHGNMICEKLSERVKARFVSGVNDSETRKQAISDLQSGMLDVLVSTRIFNEGVDLPIVSAVIMASGGKSPIKVYQSYGRGITKTPTKNETVIIDFYDHAHPRLLEHSEERRHIVESDPAFDVQDVTLEEV